MNESSAAHDPVTESLSPPQLVSINKGFAESFPLATARLDNQGPNPGADDKARKASISGERSSLSRYFEA